MKKLDGIFGFTLGQKFQENDFKILSKEFSHGVYHIAIDNPIKPNVLFKDYSVTCSKDLIILDISAKTLSPIPFEDAAARQSDLGNYFVENYFENYSIYFWEFEQFMHIYEFIPFDKKVIPLRKDYKKFINQDETSKELTLTIFGESDKFKQVEILLSTKFKNKEYEYEDYDPRIFDTKNLVKFDTGKGYELDVTGL